MQSLNCAWIPETTVCFSLYDLKGPEYEKTIETLLGMGLNPSHEALHGISAEQFLAWARIETNTDLDPEVGKKLALLFAKQTATLELHESCRRGRVDSVKALLRNYYEKGNLMIDFAINGQTPLMVAYSQGHTEIVEQLLLHDADTEKVSGLVGGTDESIKSLARHKEGMAFLKAARTGELDYLQAKLDVHPELISFCLYNKWTALHNAAA